MARLIHRLRSDDPGQHYALLQAARKRLSAGGARRLRHTLPPIAFAALDVVRRLAAAGPAAREPSQKEVRWPLWSRVHTSTACSLTLHSASASGREGLGDWAQSRPVHPRAGQVCLMTGHILHPTAR